MYIRSFAVCSNASFLHLKFLLFLFAQFAVFKVRSFAFALNPFAQMPCHRKKLRWFEMHVEKSLSEYLYF